PLQVSGDLGDFLLARCQERRQRRGKWARHSLRQVFCAIQQLFHRPRDVVVHQDPPRNLARATACSCSSTRASSSSLAIIDSATGSCRSASPISPHPCWNDVPCFPKRDRAKSAP